MGGTGRPVARDGKNERNGSKRGGWMYNRARMAKRKSWNVYLHQGGICMRSKTIFALAAAAILLLVVAGASAQGNLTQNEQLGKKLFFDTNLSTPSGLACAGCHGAEVGYTGPDAAINAAGAGYEGAMAGRFGNRKPPSAAYAVEGDVAEVSEEQNPPKDCQRQRAHKFAK